MTAALYDAGRQKFIEGNIAILTDTIKMALVDAADYTVNLATDDFFNDIAGAAIVGTAATLASKTSTAGVFDAADVTYTSVTGDQSEALVIYKDTGVSSTSPLISYVDTYSGLPVTPNGNNITVTFDSGSNRIWKI